MSWVNISKLSQFIGLINLDTSHAEDKEIIQDYASDIEIEVLSSLLSDTEMVDYLADKTKAKYVNLISGYYEGTTLKLFTYENIDRYFAGIGEKLCYKIYFEYSKDQYFANSHIGDVQANPGAGILAYNEGKGIKVYNTFVDRYNAAIDFMLYYNTLVADTYLKTTLSRMDKINSFGI